MELTFQLHWLRETAYDAGTPIVAEEIDSVVREKVLRAAEGTSGPLRLKLPYLDRRELRRRLEVMGPVQFERHGDAILPRLKPRLALRTLAADLSMSHPAWTSAPYERSPEYFKRWQKVSQTLQRSFRRWFTQEYFEDIRKCQDREASYPVVIYSAARVYCGYPPSDFTYDLRDFPECTDTLESSWKMIGAHTRKALAVLEARLHHAGMDALARRYSPRWFEDVLIEVRHRPRPLVELLAVEAELINAVIDLGTARTPEAVCRFSKLANLRLRNFYGIDVRPLVLRSLDETTRVLQGLSGGLPRAQGAPGRTRVPLSEPIYGGHFPEKSR